MFKSVQISWKLQQIMSLISFLHKKAYFSNEPCKQQFNEQDINTFLGTIKAVVLSIFDLPMKTVPNKANAECTVSSSTTQNLELIA